MAGEDGLSDEIEVDVVVRSNDDKAIRAVSGTIELVFEGAAIASPRITLAEPVAAHAETTLFLVYPVTRDSGRLMGPDKAKVIALACIGHIDYVDGSGVIVN